jgi:hypothetical protein
VFSWVVGEVGDGCVCCGGFPVYIYMKLGVVPGGVEVEEVDGIICLGGGFKLDIPVDCHDVMSYVVGCHLC